MPCWSSRREQRRPLSRVRCSSMRRTFYDSHYTQNPGGGWECARATSVTRSPPVGTPAAPCCHHLGSGQRPLHRARRAPGAPGQPRGPRSSARRSRAGKALPEPGVDGPPGGTRGPSEQDEERLAPAQRASTGWAEPDDGMTGLGETALRCPRVAEPTRRAQGRKRSHGGSFGDRKAAAKREEEARGEQLEPGCARGARERGGGRGRPSARPRGSRGWGYRE